MEINSVISPYKYNNFTYNRISFGQSQSSANAINDGPSCDTFEFSENDPLGEVTKTSTQTGDDSELLLALKRIIGKDQLSRISLDRLVQFLTEEGELIPSEVNCIDLKNVTTQESKQDIYKNKLKEKDLQNVNEKVINTLRECENLTFDSPNLKLMKNRYDKDNIYDLGLRYAIVANNTMRVKGSGAIINEVPKMFEGIDEDELLTGLDNLTVSLKTKALNKFSLGDKNYTAHRIGKGETNNIYLITDESGDKVCFRCAKKPYLSSYGQGVYNELAITQEANKAGVTDIPKLYMANPIGKYVNDGHTKGCWQIVEYIDEDVQQPKNSLKLFDWLKQKGLDHYDYNSGTIVHGKIVDMGGIQDNERTLINTVGDFSWLPLGYNSGKDTSSIINLAQQMNTTKEQ